MNYLFDSSSILRAISKDKISALAGNYTLDLARYELGNLIWKRRTLIKDLGRDECKQLIEVIKRTLSIMEILSIKCHEAEIAEISENLNLTFYDASYVFAAKSKSTPPVTGDSEIKRKASNYIRILSVEDLI